MALSVWAALAATVVAGCSASDSRDATWQYLSPALFQPTCATASCHSRAAAVAGLDFSDPDRGYTSLTGLQVAVSDPAATTPAPDSATPSARPLVTPFVPAQSRLVNMLRARGAPRMPPDRPLSQADIRLVERWILAGATKGDGPVKDGGRPDATDAAHPPSDSAADATADASAGNDATAADPASSRLDASDGGGQ